MILILAIGTGYSGYKTILPSDEKISAFYENKGFNHFNLSENEYLLIADENGTALDHYKWQDGRYKSVTKKPIESSTLGKVKAKNPEQVCALDALLDETTTVKVLSGGFGSGKTFLACAAAFN